VAKREGNRYLPIAGTVEPGAAADFAAVLDPIFRLPLPEHPLLLLGERARTNAPAREGLLAAGTLRVKLASIACGVSHGDDWRTVPMSLRRQSGCKAEVSFEALGTDGVAVELGMHAKLGPIGALWLVHGTERWRLEPFEEPFPRTTRLVTPSMPLTLDMRTVGGPAGVPLDQLALDAAFEPAIVGAVLVD
jgi:hypothetical protein